MDDAPGGRSFAALRAPLKHALETMAVRSGVAAANRRLTGRAVVLAYHNIVPRGERQVGDGSLHVKQADFADQLDALGDTHDVVGLDDLLAPAAGGRPRAAITIDDAYAGAATAGVEELARRGFPATIFVAPMFLDGRSFWWDALADPRTRELDPAVRHHALALLGGDDEAIRGWASADGRSLHEPPAHARGAAVADLHVAVSHQGIQLGGHTWSHPNLHSVSGATLRDELERPLRWLRERFSAVVPWLAYPYGHFTPEAEAVAAEVGYSGAFRVDGGPIRQREHGFRLPRVNVPAGMSVAGLTLRTSGLLRG